MNPIHLIAIGLICLTTIGISERACAGYEECNTYGNRTECRGSDGSYREEYDYGDHSECRGDCNE